MFMPVLDIPQSLRDEPTSVAAVGPVLAHIFRRVTDQLPPREMRELLRRMRGQIDPQPDLPPRNRNIGQS
jgi:hypothetical protein